MQVCGTRATQRRPGVTPFAASACLTRAMTRTPRCPGCGAHTSSPWCLCRICADLLAQARAERVRDDGATARFFLNDGRLESVVGGPSDERRAWVAPFLDLLGAVPAAREPSREPTPEAFPPPLTDDRYHARKWFAVTLSFERWGALQRLVRAVAALVRASAAEGKREGSHILLQLARGELTFNDFERRTEGCDDDR